MQLKPIVLEVLSAFKKRDQKRLRKLNDVLLKLAGIEFTKPLFELATITYIFSKITSKPRLMEKERLDDLKRIEEAFADAAGSLDTQPEERTMQLFSALSRMIAAFDKKDQRYMRDLICKGKLKVAVTMYAQGLSLGLSSELAGVSKQDILEYSGKTMMFDRVKEEKGIMERLKMARRFAGG